MESLAAVCLSGLLILAGAGVGRILRAFFGQQDESLDERFVYDTALGLGTISLLMFLLAALQCLKYGWIPVVTCALGVLGLGIWMPGILAGISRLLKRKRTKWQILCVLLILMLFLTALIPAIAPPSMSDWDSLAYHLAVIKLWIKHGGFYYIDFVSHSNFPFLTEMLYVPGVLLNQPGAAKLVHFWIGVLLVNAVSILARRHICRGCTWPSAIAVAGMPIVLWEATTAYIDLATAFYTVASVSLILNYFDNSDRRYLTLCAVLVGFAASTKMTALALIPLLVIWLLAEEYASERRVSGRNALRFVAIALIVCSPWYVKTWIYTGNPVYPFFYELFDGRDWSAELARNYSLLQRHFGLGHEPSAFVTLPFDLAFRSDAFYDTPGLYVGPLFIAAVPILLVARYGSRRLVGLLIFVVAQVLIWFALTQQSRYLIPTLAVLAPLATGLLWREMRFQKARPAWWAMVVATALFGLWTILPASKQALPCVLGLQDRGEYLNNTLDIYPAVQFVNDNLPANAKLALFGDTRGFYLDCNYVWADYGHNLRFSKHCRSLEDFMRLMKSEGVTHALVNFRFFPDEKDAIGNAKFVYQAIREGRFVPIYPPSDDGRGVIVFRVK